MGCRPTAPPPGDHAGWHLGPVASLDLETTGVDPLRDRVVSFALLDDQVERSGLVDPGVPIPEGASAVHGLDAAALRGAPAPRGALTEVLDWVQQVVDRGVPLVVFNAPYDLTMLRAEAERWGLVQPDWSRLLVIDPYVVDWGIVRGELGPRRLTDVAAYYEVELANAHDALADARAALEVARQIAARHVGVGTATVEDLVTDQRRWYAERADDWNRWARTAGRELDDPQGWPLITAATVRRSA
ncbi:exonuclease domain-containing protein [Aeromicrobium marinum]|uniref:exonuclease domain-containing protein n=1 Tax=Aeromicrobium marinum TaxID=219314 RepID=UPI0001D01809|nr:exonuclease domain-containing protein [Aeromicrobium marinum]